MELLLHWPRDHTIDLRTSIPQLERLGLGFKHRRSLQFKELSPSTYTARTVKVVSWDLRKQSMFQTPDHALALRISLQLSRCPHKDVHGTHLQIWFMDISRPLRLESREKNQESAFLLWAHSDADQWLANTCGYHSWRTWGLNQSGHLDISGIPNHKVWDLLLSEQVEQIRF